ncbi:hypothetical protein ACHAW5_003877 [Stephanodiscus triporus]|uniref:Histone deacetylase domain-containing protein n=1 Tax=Stephanodiscus triporus TaxID=2934178 RepID=A0ABD3MTS9_9STRA
MASILVISAEQPTPAAASSSSPDAAADAFDRHNRPRMRRDVILSALAGRYPGLTKFVVVVASPPPPRSSSSPSSPGDALIGLYRPVHDADMVRFLVDAWARWTAMGPGWDADNCHREWRPGSGTEPPLVPLHSAFRRDGIERPSGNVMGAIGYYCTDLITPIVGTLARELEEDARVICSAVDRAFDLDEEDRRRAHSVVYAVTTHPGHHASYDCFGGYCYLNNAALCARLMQRRIETGRRIVAEDDGEIVANYWDDGEDDRVVDDDEKFVDECRFDDNKDDEEWEPIARRIELYGRPRVAIIDVDYHCGNGTASIFYRDPSVFFVSIHCDPEIDYPWNSGFADQTGAGDGEGTTMHVPLGKGAGWSDRYEASLRDAMSAIAKFRPQALVVSLGLDTYDGDAVAVNRGGFKLSGKDYVEMGRLIGSYMAKKDVPCVFVQEGGYKMDVVGDAAADVVGGYAMAIGEEGG